MSYYYGNYYGGLGYGLGGFSGLGYGYGSSYGLGGYGGYGYGYGYSHPSFYGGYWSTGFY
ncbi:keratin-associated protein 19-9b-like [Nannospalax galili]|uniref:Keratin-associated protein 19-9b-like n=1 Tax=Nannospalax galili TaxID=1026970 RepID=A0A8C6R272_NANGA|nr:keratin-associated protein 19-9b-like [Nannospalax galili]